MIRFIAIVERTFSVFGPRLPSQPSFLRSPLQPAPEMSNPRVFFDITIGGKAAGRITMEVRAKRDVSAAGALWANRREAPVADRLV